MPRMLRSLGVLAGALLLSTQVEAATVELAWDANPAAENVVRYWVGYRNSPTAAETLANAGNTTGWTSPNLGPGTWFFRVYAENSAGLRSGPSTEVSTTITTTTPPPTGGGFAMDRGRLNYGAVRSGTTSTLMTPAQTLIVNQISGSPAAWTATTNQSWLRVSPSSGTGTGQLTVSVVPGSTNVGTYDGTVSLRPTGTTTVLNVAVRMRIYLSGTTALSGGFFDTPTDGIVNVAGSLPVTGWAVDDVGVARVEIYRDPVAGETGQPFIGTATFISGSRPDVEANYSEYPLAYRAGWGYMVLTNMMPDQNTGRSTGGNGPFRLHAYAVDIEGRARYLGSKRISVNNAAAVKPFGAIDTPTQGGTASGSSYAVFGWALSPRGTIPTNGSTISVFVDGVNRGRPTYNNFRSDIASLFPGYANSNGAVGYFMLNTTGLTNGLHTISWTVTDNLGNTEGIGSRYFNVMNGGVGALTSAIQSSTIASSATSQGEAIGQSAEAVAAEVPPDYSIVEVTKAAAEDQTPQLVFPEWSGEIVLETKETEAVEVRLANQFTDNLGGTYEGYVVIAGDMRPLPIGSFLDTNRGVFKWQPGPGFVGNYELVFLRSIPGGFKTRVPVRLRIAPKFERDDSVEREKK
jgi:hypothetical protein